MLLSLDFKEDIVSIPVLASDRGVQLHPASSAHERDDHFNDISSLLVTASVNSEREQGIRTR